MSPLAVTISLIVTCMSPMHDRNLTLDTVDVIEHNTVYDLMGEPQVKQLIFWDWAPSMGEHLVVAYRTPKSFQVRQDTAGSWIVTFQDGSFMRQVRARSFRRTHTQFDPELEHREILAVADRRELYSATRVREIRQQIIPQ